MTRIGTLQAMISSSGTGPRWLLLVAAAAAFVAWWLWPREPETVPGTVSDPTAAPVVEEKKTVPGTVFRAPLGVPFEATWGKDGIGRQEADETNPEGPMALVVGPGGTLWILDQVNQRIVRIGKGGKDSVRMPLLAAQDLKATKNGGAVVLDRLADKAVYVTDARGERVGTLPIEGKGIKDTGAVSGVFVDDDDVYVEREHGQLVHVGKTDGTPSTTRHELIGRPTPDSRSLLNAGVSGRNAIFVTVLDRAAGAQRFTRLIPFDEPVQHIAELDADTLGTVYVAVVLGQAGQGHLIVHCLSDTDGEPKGRVDLPLSPLADETFRDVAVNPAGGFVYARRTRDGVKYETHRCQ